MSTPSPNLDVIKLVGDAKESFYQLGQKDKFSYQICLEHMKNLIGIGPLAPVLEKIIKISSYYKKSYPYSFQYLEQYVSGLDAKAEEILLVFNLIDLMNAIPKFLPSSFIGLGCSSYFHYDEKKHEFLHGRNLDFPLWGSFDENERLVSYQLNGMSKIISLTPSGCALPFLSSMNEHGLTLAIHQKYSTYFNLEGRAIADIAFEIINECQDVAQVTKKLKTISSQSMWGMYCLDKQGQVLAADLKGKESYQKTFDLSKQKSLYFNNEALNENEDFIKWPLGLHANNKERASTVLQLDKSRKQGKSKVFHVLSSSSPQEGPSAKNWVARPISLSTLHTACFNTSSLQLDVLSGEAPINIDKTPLIHAADLFGQVELKATLPKNRDDDYFKALRFLGLAQRDFDYGRIDSCFHNFQLAIKNLKNLEEQSLAKFFFLVVQYLTCQSNEDFKLIFQDLIALKDKLPDYQDDLRKLFCSRCAKFTGNEEPQDNSMQNAELKTIYDKEKSWNTIQLKLARKLIKIRIEIFDVIHIG